MDLNRFTEKAQEAVLASQKLAVKQSHQQVDVEHVFLALLDQEQGLAGPIIEKAGGSPESLRRKVEQEIGRLPRVSGASGAPADQMYLTGRLNRLIVQAEDEAKKLTDDFVSVEHLLLAMTDDGGATGRMLKEAGVTRKTIMEALKEVRGHQRVTSQNPEVTYQALERYGRDLDRKSVV